MPDLPSEPSPLLERLKIAAVIFDLDGVLVDSMPFHYEAYRRVLAAEGFAVERADIYLREGLGTPDVLRSLSAERGWDLTPQRIKELADHRRAVFYEIYRHRVFAEIPALLGWLSGCGYRLAVVSGATEQSLDMCLNEYAVNGGPGGLGQWFPIAVSGTSVARGKPFPDPYLEALKKLGLPAGRALVVENAPMGITAARAAGCRSVALATTLERSHLAGADWVLDNHAALVRLLKEN